MSFPRARIQRFNDATTSTPAPGSYDPKFDLKVKGTVIEKCERFVDPKCSNTVQECDSPLPLSTKSSSLNCLPVFRTPQLPRKAQKTSSKCKSKENVERKDSCTDTEDSSKGRELFPESSPLSIIKEALEKTSVELHTIKDKCTTLDCVVASQKEYICELEHRNVVLEIEVQRLQGELCETNVRHQESVSDFEKSSRECLDQLKEMHSMLNEKTFGFEDDMKKAREELVILASLNSDFEQKVSQKQQMILLLQSELSNSAVELVECRSEFERTNSEFNLMKSTLIAKHHDEMEGLHNIISELEQRLEGEHEDNIRQLQVLSDNLMNGSVVRENLETTLTEKEVALWAMETSYGKLLAECEHLKEVHSHEIEKNRCDYELKIREIQNNLQMMANFVENHCLNFKLKCDGKLEELERKYKGVLEGNCEDWQVKIAQLRTVIKNNKDKLVQVEARAQEETAALGSLLASKDEDAGARIAKLEAEARALTEKLVQAEEDLRRVSITRDELRISNMDNQLTVVDLQDKLDTVATEKNALCESLATVSAERDSLKAQNKVLTVGNRNLNESLEALGIRLLDSERDVEHVTSVNERIKAEELVLQREIKTVREELDNQRTNIAKMEAENMQQIEEVRMDLLGKLESLKCKAILDSETMQKEDAEKQLQIQELSVQLDMFRKEFQELSTYVAAMELENEEQSRRIQTFEAQGSQLEETAIRLAMQEEAFHSLTTNFNKQAADLKHCKSDQLSAQAKITTQEEEILEYKCNIEQLSADIEGTEARILELNEAVNTLEETNAEHEREMEALTEKLDHQRDCAQVANQQIAALEASHTIQEHQYQSLASELECHKDYSHQATEHILKLRSANNEKEKQIEHLLDETELLNAKIQEMNEKTEVLDGQLISEREKLKESVGEIKLLEADRFVKEEQLKDFMAELNRGQHCVQEMVKQIDALEKLQIEEQNKVKIVQSEMDTLEKEKTVMEQTLQAVEVELAEAIQSTKREIDKRKQIEAQLSKVETKVTSLTEVKSDLELAVHELTRKNKKLAEDSMRERTRLEASSFELATQRSLLEDVFHSKQVELDSCKNMCGNLQQKVDKLSEQIKDNTEVERLEAELKEVVEKNEKLMNENTRKVALQSENLDLVAEKSKLNDALHCTQLELEFNKNMCNELQQKIEEQNIMLNELKQQFEEQILAKREAEEQTLASQERYHELELLIGPFKEQLEAYRSECHHLESFKEAASEAMRDLSMKYANILGHQNHKQKIRHLVKLKENNLELKEEVQRLECQVRTLKRTIDKLRKELVGASRKPSVPHQTVGSGKDNLMHSPVRIPASQTSGALGKENLVRSPASVGASHPLATTGKEALVHNLVRTGLPHQSASTGKENLVHSPARKSPVASPNPKPLCERPAHSNVV